MAEVAALVGDPARANILDTLLDGRAFTATELAFAARVGAPTASAHLAKLLEARLLSVVKQGRHRYYRLASPLVARMLESIMAVAAIEMPPRYRPRSPRDEALLLGRTCYDHLAGRLGVGIAAALVARSQVVPERRCRRSDGRRREVLRRSRHRPRGGEAAEPAPVLPAVPRLQRTPLPSRGRSRRHARAPLLRAPLDRAAARQPGGDDHADRARRLAQRVRPRPPPAARARARAAARRRHSPATAPVPRSRRRGRGRSCDGARWRSCGTRPSRRYGGRRAGRRWSTA